MSVRRVRFHEYKRAARTLAEAFRGDEMGPFFTRCDGQSNERSDRLDVEMYEYIVYAHLLNGLVLTIGDFEGVSCWMGPGKNMDDWCTILRSGMWRINYKLGREGRHRFFTEFLPLLRRTK